MYKKVCSGQLGNRHIHRTITLPLVHASRVNNPCRDDNLIIRPLFGSEGFHSTKFGECYYLQTLLNLTLFTTFNDYMVA